MKKINFINIKKNSKEHHENLYQILEKKTYSISHYDLPSFEEHKNFVANNTYRIWNIIKMDNVILGSFYITFDNSIGINLIEAKYNLYLDIIQKILIEYKPLKEKKSLRSKYFIFNSNPKNNLLIKALKKIGTEHIQNTYALKNYLIKDF